jgi:predicted NAD/FAD-dependent oxidoreductase
MCIRDRDISFITDNNLKGVNSLKTALTIEMSDEFSRKYWDIPVQKTASKIIEVSGEYIGADILDYHIHKWRYSIPRKSYPKKFEYINDPGPIYLAGDAFMGNSAESAFLSGLHAAESLILTNELKVKPAEI